MSPHDHVTIDNNPFPAAVAAIAAWIASTAA